MSATESLIERLKKWSDPAEGERISQHWDAWRAYIKKGGGGSWPRDAFESLVDAFGQDGSEAAAELEALRSRCESMERELSDMASMSFGCSGRSAKDINEWFNEKAHSALAARALQQGGKAE